MGVTIYDIAKETGLSSATVSRVLSGKGSAKDETISIIKDCADRLGYKNKKRLKEAEKCNEKIMVIVSDLANPFFLGIILGIENILVAQGYKVAIFQTNNIVSREEEYVRFAHSDSYSGIIMITAIETLDLIKLLSKNVCPVVLVNRFIRSLDLNSVCIDNFRGGYIATKYLIDKGHSHIAHLAGPSYSTASDDRHRGYQAALKDCGLEYKKASVFHGDLKPESGLAFAEYFYKSLGSYTAVFSANDIMAVSFINAMAERGVKVPEDVSIICFDDTPVATQGSIKLTTVSRNPESMGEAAAEMMISILSNKNSSTRKLIFPPILNERGSVLDLNGNNKKQDRND